MFLKKTFTDEYSTVCSPIDFLTKLQQQKSKEDWDGSRNAAKVLSTQITHIQHIKMLMIIMTHFIDPLGEMVAGQLPDSTFRQLSVYLNTVKMS